MKRTVARSVGMLSFVGVLVAGMSTFAYYSRNTTGSIATDYNRELTVPLT